MMNQSLRLFVKRAVRRVELKYLSSSVNAQIAQAFVKRQALVLLQHPHGKSLGKVNVHIAAQKSRLK